MHAHIHIPVSGVCWEGAHHVKLRLCGLPHQFGVDSLPSASLPLRVLLLDHSIGVPHVVKATEIGTEPDVEIKQRL